MSRKRFDSTFFAPMQVQRATLLNPFSGLDDRGFQRGTYTDPVWKQYIIEQITKVLPAGWSVLFMYYSPERAPEPIVKLFLTKPDTSTVEHEIQVPIDPKLRKWGGRVPKVLVDFVRLTYAP